MDYELLQTVRDDVVRDDADFEGGRRRMEYLAYRGVFADIPFEEIRGAFRHYYPRMTRQQEKMPLGGDFGVEGAQEAIDKGRK